MFWKILAQIARIALRGILLSSMVVYPSLAQSGAGSTAAVSAPALAENGAAPATGSAASASPVVVLAAPQLADTAELEGLTISPPALPGGVQGVGYTQNISVSGGTAPYTVTSTLDSAATGLTFAGSEGSYTVSGVPATAGDVIFVVTASDNSSPAQTVTQEYTIWVQPAGDPPSISATVFGEYGKDDWYRSDVTVHWDIVDDKPLNPANPCPDETFTAEGLHTAICTAASADGSTTVEFPVNIDKTRPVVSGAAPQRPPDQDGFYTAPISFTVTGTDALSGIDFCPDATYSGPNTTSGTVDGYCFDTAGNQSLPFSISPIKYNTGGPVPVVTYSLERLPDKNGWYNHPVNLGWAVSSANMEDCIVTYTTQEAGTPVDVPMQSMQSYAGPDTQKVTLVGKCQNASGSWGESAPLELKYDSSAPVDVAGAPARPADYNGWYNQPVDILFSGTDAASGIESCTQVSYSNPSGAGVTVTGTCTDLAGNTSAAVDSAAFNYDNSTPASVTGAPARPADYNGWYNAPVDIQFSGTDDVSGIASCTLASYSGPDGTGITVPGTCTDNAGNTSRPVDSTAFNYDASAPAGVSGAPVRPADHNGWYNAPVNVQFTGTDATSGIETCTLVEYNGPDGRAASIPGSCTDLAGNTSPTVQSAAFDYDNTDPENVSGAPVRPPDHNGWYNEPVDVQFTGTDATSGIDVCSLVRYDGPDGRGVTASGFCEDVAGNTGAPVSSAAFDYDNTDPLVRAVLDVEGPVILRQPVQVVWDATDETAGVDWSVSYCAQPDSSQVGLHSLACQVWDIAGNGPATASLGYSVIYRFEGFFRPVWEGWNEENAGRTLPIKWHLADYSYADVDGAAVSIAVTPVSCAVDGLQPYAGSTSIEQDLQPQKHGNYHYGWKTEKGETGCAQVAIDLQEGPGVAHLIYILWK